MRMYQLKSALVVLTIFLTPSCSHQTWEWEAKPWTADHANQRITNGKGEYVDFSQPSIEEYIAFHYTNIAELKAEIDELQLSRKQKQRLLKYFVRIKLENYHEKFGH